jgi:hypothetical protein
MTSGGDDRRRENIAVLEAHGEVESSLRGFLKEQTRDARLGGLSINASIV